jgi:hypothetical protein
MTPFFKRRRHDPFAARQPVEVSLSAESTEALADLKDRYRIAVTLPAEPFDVYLES